MNGNAPPILHFGPVRREDVEVISNNSAELMAAKKLLEWLIEQDIREKSVVEIKPDSMLVIKWLSGVARSHHHREIISECRAMFVQLRRKVIIRRRHVRAHIGEY